MFFTDKYETVGETLLKTYNVLRYEASLHVHYKCEELLLVTLVKCLYVFVHFIVIYQSCLQLLHHIWINSS